MKAAAEFDHPEPWSKDRDRSKRRTLPDELHNFMTVP